jgi:hypothetical protein
LDCYDLPDDGPIAPLADLRAATESATTRRLAAHYIILAETLPGLITELTRAAHGYTGRPGPGWCPGFWGSWPAGAARARLVSRVLAVVARRGARVPGAGRRRGCPG